MDTDVWILCTVAPFCKTQMFVRQDAVRFFCSDHFSRVRIYGYFVDVFLSILFLMWTFLSSNFAAIIKFKDTSSSSGNNYTWHYIKVSQLPYTNQLNNPGLYASHFSLPQVKPVQSLQQYRSQPPQSHAEQSYPPRLPQQSPHSVSAHVEQGQQITRMLLSDKLRIANT